MKIIPKNEFSVYSDDDGMTRVNVLFVEIMIIFSTNVKQTITFYLPSKCLKSVIINYRVPLVIFLLLKFSFRRLRKLWVQWHLFGQPRFSTKVLVEVLRVDSECLRTGLAVKANQTMKIFFVFDHWNISLKNG
jgi:hypothetical protein